MTGQTAPPQEPPTEEAVLAALTLLMLTPDVPQPDLVAAVEALFAPLGIAADAARAAGLLGFGAPLLDRREGVGQAYGWTARTAPARRAAYVLNAAQRIHDAYERVLPQRRAAESLRAVGDETEALKLREQAARDASFEERERTYLAQHLNAERARASAAARVDAASAVYGPLLGWRSRRDDLVTPECRAADGRNFRADRPPVIGWPGTPHGGTCRCVPVGPFDGAAMLA